jgi:hypothetical protein
VGQRTRRQRRRAQEKPCPKTTGGCVKAAATARPARFELFRIICTRGTSGAGRVASHSYAKFDKHVKSECHWRGLTPRRWRPRVQRPSVSSLPSCSMLASPPRRPSPQGRDRRASRRGLALRSSAVLGRAAPAAIWLFPLSMFPPVGWAWCCASRCSQAKRWSFSSGHPVGRSSVASASFAGARKSTTFYEPVFSSTASSSRPNSAR